MRILIYLEQSKIIEKMKSKFEVNPGFGGTTYTAARLAIELKKESDKNNLDFEITLFTNNPVKNEFFNVKVISREQACLEKWDIALLTGNIMQNI